MERSEKLKLIDDMLKSLDYPLEDYLQDKGIEEDEYITVKEAEAILQVTRPTIYAWSKDPEHPIEIYKIGTLSRVKKKGVMDMFTRLASKKERQAQMADGMFRFLGNAPDGFLEADDGEPINLLSE